MQDQSLIAYPQDEKDKQHYVLIAISRKKRYMHPSQRINTK